MKNIHIIPTKNPSRLLKLEGNFYLWSIPVKSYNFESYHVYITSDDEKIEVGNFAIFNNDVCLLEYCDDRSDLCKKVILTTDPNLISQGIQPIEDDFLNWFVNNPNCDFIEVYNNQSVSYEYSSYAMIIPESNKPKEYKTSVEWLISQIVEDQIIKAMDKFEYDFGYLKLSMKLDINEMKDLIVSQQLEIKNLQKKVDYLQDSHDKRQEWLSKAKREAGKDYGISFDVVWKEMLDKPTWDDVRKAMFDLGDFLFKNNRKGIKVGDPEKYFELIIQELKKSKTK